MGGARSVHLQRLGGLMSMTERVGPAEGLAFDSMSLPLRLLAGPGASSRSGVKTLLPLLVLGDCSVGLKLTGERKLWTCVRRARGKVFRPESQTRYSELFVSVSSLLRTGAKEKHPTIAVILKAVRNAVSPWIRPSFPGLLKHGKVGLCGGKQRHSYHRGGAKTKAKQNLS